jgi:hypothetical protein
VDFWGFRAERFLYAENAQKIRSADEALRGVWKAVCVAEEVGESVGRSEVLLGCVSDEEERRHPWLMKFSSVR